jgi:curli production assembly/transport component CsgF
MIRLSVAITGGLAGAMMVAGAAFASQLTYAPVNPTFGGNPLNGSYLLSVAQSQGYGVAGKNASPDLSGLDQAIQSLSTGLGNIGNLSVSPSVGAPIIILGSGTIPTNP